jgi:transposase
MKGQLKVTGGADRLGADMIRPQGTGGQAEFWIARSELTRTQASKFYDKLGETLEKMDFSRRVRAFCAPVYTSGQMGRPPIDPVVYFKMLMVGFLENLPSERAIAARCGDSLMIRRFLGYELDEETPHHSSFTVIRQRLSGEVYQAVFDVILATLREHGLLRGKNLGIDSSVIEANASLRGLESRNTGEAYWDYVKGLATEAGVDGSDPAAVRRFDKQRPGRKTSNLDWVNPHDPEAKVAQAKDGATDMLYKPEHIVDLDTGAILSAEVRQADQADTQGLTERVVAVAALVEAIVEDVRRKEEQPCPAAVATLTADKGYYCVAELEAIQACGIKTVISDPLRNRRCDKLESAQRAVVRKAQRSAQSNYGTALLRKRGMHIERSFAHLLDCGGIRRATLRGQVNLDKRYKIAAASYNLSQLMRHLFGIGTPKQAAAATLAALMQLVHLLSLRLLSTPGSLRSKIGESHLSHQFLHFFRHRFPESRNVTISTGC